MRWLLFFRNNTDFDLFEPGGFKPTMEIAGFETKPAVAVEFLRLFKIMFQQIENHDLPTRSKNLISADKRVTRSFGVMQRLAENNEIDALRRDRRCLQFAKPEFEIFQAVLFRFLRAESHHLLRIIDSDDMLGAASEQFAEQPFA